VADEINVLRQLARENTTADGKLGGYMDPRELEVALICHVQLGQVDLGQSTDLG
jgi:hypothetical protein